MQQSEIVSIVDLVAAADGRNVTEQTYGAWFLLLKDFEFGLVREATLEAMRDESLRWVEPKHILGRINKIRDRYFTEKHRERLLEEMDSAISTEPPVCLAHNKVILRCDTCCKKASKISAESGGIHSEKYQTRFWSEVCYPVTG